MRVFAESEKDSGSQDRVVWIDWAYAPARLKEEQTGHFVPNSMAVPCDENHSNRVLAAGALHQALARSTRGAEFLTGGSEVGYFLAI